MAATGPTVQTVEMEEMAETRRLCKCESRSDPELTPFFK
jgi:hypothetical protein